MNLSEIVGFLGTGLVLVAYLPQIIHLAKEHCAAGISRNAFLLWFIGGLLLLGHALMINSAVFTAVQTVNAIATGFILIFATKYKYGVCEGHSVIPLANKK